MIEAAFQPLLLFLKLSVILMVIFFIVDVAVYYGGMWIYREYTGTSKSEAREKFWGTGKIAGLSVVTPLFIFMLNKIL